VADARVRGSAPIGRATTGLRQWAAHPRAAPAAGLRVEEDTMGKTGRKRRARKKKGANHGKRPNA